MARLGSLQELPTGEVGEIVTHGPQVFQGYWNRPEQTAAAFVEIDGESHRYLLGPQIIALGQSYPETGGLNNSALHWDLIVDTRRGGRLTADGRVVMEDGIWRVG